MAITIKCGKKGKLKTSTNSAYIWIYLLLACYNGSFFKHILEKESMLSMLKKWNEFSTEGICSTSFGRLEF